ncbi:MAG TPA: DUF2334 domain-containing protein [Desulfitobacteriaceae bacterium]|nr:DUF2334 domain-containing protein [Desulfitobacteriaceae bacterium]
MRIPKSLFIGLVLISIVFCTLLFCKTLSSRESYQKIKQISQATKDSLDIKFEGKDLNLTQAIYIHENRYYLPLNELISQANGKCSIAGNTIIIEVSNLKRTINTETNSFNSDGNQIKLRMNIIFNEDNVYLAMIDICRLLNLKTDWDIEHNMVSFYFNRDKLIHKKYPTLGKPALIRIEDISAGPLYNQPEALAKLRIITDYLYSEHVPFHVAWVPRFIDPRPSSYTDNDISKKNSMINADFVYTLDYMLDKNGLIGLHGYTHQYGNTVSLCGTEFHLEANDGIPATDQYVQERINLAINTANKLDIPYSFFEVPHYTIAAEELKVLEDNFKILYQSYPGEPNKIVDKINDDHDTKYIPTPLEYVKGKNDISGVMQRINNLEDSTLASFYYHPFLEFSEIQTFKESDGYPSYTYNETSILHQLIDLFNEKGYKFITVNDINN